MLQSLGAVLDGARLVRHDPLHEITYAWFGGHGLHGFDHSGMTVEFWNPGSFSKDNLDIEEAEESINRHIEASHGNIE